MRISVVVCIMSFIALFLILRRDRVSLGLPIAYMANLLVLHVPGAIAKSLSHVESPLLTPPGYTRIGIILTALGSVAFVFGVWVAHYRKPIPHPRPAPRTLFWKYCVLAGGLVTVISYIVKIPSVTAVLSRGGPIWMIGLILALRSTISRGETAKAMRWLSVLAIYPILMLLIGGFLSFGSMAVIVVVSGIAITTRSPVKVTVATILLFVVGISLFMAYFEHRPEIRAAVWGGGDTDARIDASLAALQDVKLPNLADGRQLYALDQRLNQNYFVGLAQTRIDDGRVNYLYGRSVWEGLQSLVPRALWPEKPVVAGSPKIVAEMTGLTLSTSTSFGVGNVMEFDINFGAAGVFVGFLILGLLLGILDRRAAVADSEGRLRDMFLYFLPAIALIQPNGSLVDIMSGAAAAIAAAYAWRWAWDKWPKPAARVYVPIQAAEPLPS